MFNWKTKAATNVDSDSNTGAEEEEDILSIVDLSVYSQIAKSYVNAGTAYSTNYEEFYAALSRLEKVWNLWGDSSMVKPFEQNYRDCEEYMNACRRIQRQLNTASAGALKIGSVLSGKR